MAAFGEFLATASYSPRMARHRLLHAWIIHKKLRMLERFLWSGESITTRYPDMWIGPVYREKIAIPPNGRRLVVILQHSPQGYHQKINVDLVVHGKVVETKSFNEQSQFFLAADVSSYSGKSIVFEIRSDSFFVPRLVHNTPDDRQLSLQLFETRVDLASPEQSQV